MNFGEYLREKRNEKGWTQPEAAAHCGIEQSYLSKLENGKAIPSDEVFEKLVASYGLDIDEVCNELEEPELERLKELSAIRTMLAGKVRKGLQMYRRSLVVGTLLIILGSGLLAAWHWLEQTDPPSEYVYESKGVVLEGESPFVFKVMPAQQELVGMSGRSYDELFRDQPTAGEASRALAATRSRLIDRLDYHRMISPIDRGEMYIEAVDGGSRTYVLVGRDTGRWPIESVYPFVFGVMCLVAGSLLYVVGARWR